MMLHHKSAGNATVQAQRCCSSRSLGVQHTAGITGRPSTAGAVAAQALSTSGRHAGSLFDDGQQPQQQHGQQQLLPSQCLNRPSSSSSKASSRNVVTCAAAAATASTELDELIGPSSLEPAVFEIVTYALKLAWTSETYYVHSWMVLLGLLKKEDSIACEVLRELGLDDIYGAWNEVLWALNVTDGLTPRAFTPYMRWGERASLIVQAAVRYGGWAGRDKVTAEDLLMAFAASDVLTSLFPDIDLSFDRIKRAVEKKTGVVYNMPGYEGAAMASQDMFL